MQNTNINSQQYDPSDFASEIEWRIEREKEHVYLWIPFVRLLMTTDIGLAWKGTIKGHEKYACIWVSHIGM